MVKYTVLIKTYINLYRKYPMGLFLKLVYLPLQMLMYMFLWLTISKNNSVDMQYMFFYYVYSILLSYAFPFLHISNDIQSDIIDGSIINILVRPVSYVTPIISRYIAWLLCYSVIFLPVLLLTILYVKVSVLNILMFLVLLALGSIVEFLIWYNVGLIALRIEKIRGLMITVNAVRGLASGALIPISILPDMFKCILNYLPFRFYIYTPIDALLSGLSTESFAINIVAAICWILVFLILQKIQWANGMRFLKINQQ